MNEANGSDAQGLTDAYARREALLEAFEAAWRRGDRPAIEDYLPDGATDPEVLLDFLHADLEYRLQAGEPARAEEYLTRFPETAGDPAFALALIVREYQLRQARELGLDDREYADRFPQFWDELAQYLPPVEGQMRRGASPAKATPAIPDTATAAFPGGNWPRPGLSETASSGSPPYPAIPGFEILNVLGIGGMGIVYKARQIRLNRLVALKMILRGEHARPEDLVRFLAEAEAVAALQHPHIVQIFEVGQHGSLPFLVLEYLEGGSLHRKLQGVPLPAGEAAQLVETLAQAIHTAHERGIIHRDLNPANILLDSEGRPKISDFGLAKRVEGACCLTQTGAIMGTPSYMAPEQASARGKGVGVPADIYALGAVLYELLTGRPPFKAPTYIETVVQVKSDEPVPPRRLLPKVPRDLETVCLKCLQKEPARRYATATALAEDLKRFLNGEPIRAQPVSWWEKGAKWARRRPAIAALSAAVVATILLAFSVVVWQWRDARRAWEEADANAAAEGRAKEKAEAAIVSQESNVRGKRRADRWKKLCSSS